MPKVMIDPGHHPDKDNTGLYGYREAPFVWAVSVALQKSLQARNIQADLTRTWTQAIGVVQRGELAKGYDMFLSQHTNASSDPTKRGVAIYYSAMQPENRFVAVRLSEAIAGAMGTNVQGAKTRQSTNYPTRYDYYGVLYGAAQKAGCPVCFLIENGYHTNHLDVKALLSEEMVVWVAETQSKFICNYFGVPYELKEEPKMEKITVRVGEKVVTTGFLDGGVSYIPTRVVLNALGILFDWHGPGGGLYITPPAPPSTISGEVSGELLQLRELRDSVATYVALVLAAKKAEDMVKFLVYPDN